MENKGRTAWGHSAAHITQAFKIRLAGAGAPASAMKFTAGYFVQFLKYQFRSPSSTLGFQTKLFFLNLVYFIAWLFLKTT
jgi:hypothetical protein